MTKHTNNKTETEAADCDENPFLRDNIYFAAKDGLSIALFALLNNIDDEKLLDRILNHVSVQCHRIRSVQLKNP